MEEFIIKILKEEIPKAFDINIDDLEIQLQETRKEFQGDITLVLFPFVKILKLSPQIVGEKISNILKDNIESITEMNQVGGFLNISLKSDNYLNDFKKIYSEEDFGTQTPNSKGKIMVEFASPNTNKPLHLGHLRNIFLGDSISNILAASGHSVVKTQIINDRGIHICKSMLAWERFSPLNAKGERETPQNTGLKGDKLVGKYYVEFDKNFKLETKEILEDWKKGDFHNYDSNTINQYQIFETAKVGKDQKNSLAIDAKIEDLAKNETSLLRDAKEMLIKWEARDPQTYLLWNTMNAWVYEGFDKTYNSLKINFDKNYYESDTFVLGKDVVLEGLKKGVFFQKPDKSVWIDLTDEGLDEKLVLRSDGTSVYMTQDIGTAIDRFKDFPDLSGMVYTVGNEQDYHFIVLFLILKKMGYSWAENCYHLSYGMVDLPTGKMKSREGTVVDADDLIADVISSAEKSTLERGHLDNMSAEEISALCKMIGLGGLKYYLLKVDPKKRMLFNPLESIDLHGNTGPFIQYCHARIKSLLAKSDRIGSFDNAEILDQEKELIKICSNFPSIIQEAASSLSPAVLANYLYNLVKTYNSYYQAVYILNEENIDNKNFRLALSKLISEIIKKGMTLLGTEVPDRM